MLHILSSYWWFWHSKIISNVENEQNRILSHFENSSSFNAKTIPTLWVNMTCSLYPFLSFATLKCPYQAFTSFCNHIIFILNIQHSVYKDMKHKSSIDLMPCRTYDNVSTTSSENAKKMVRNLEIHQPSCILSYHFQAISIIQWHWNIKQDKVHNGPWAIL